VPKFGRDLSYNWQNCDLYICGAGDEVYRLNLEAGQFKEPLMSSFVGVNKMHLNPVHGILGIGGESSVCEFFDVKSRRSVSKLRVSDSNDTEVTSFRFDTDGLTLGVGTSNGNCILYDIRSSKPLYTKEHQYGIPIIDISFHNDGASRRVLSSDKKIVKIWERDETAASSMGKIVTNIEPTAGINAVHIVKDARGKSGLIFLAGEQSRIMSYFVPTLGPAPRWCTFLEGLTEELEEGGVGAAGGAGGVYEDYKFITRQEVEELGATSLIGTPMLKGYMHGFFIEMKLWSKLRAVSKPFEYEEHRKQKIKEKIEEKRASRITPRKRLPKVNSELAEKLLSKNKKSGSDGPIIDERFASLFSREEFQQDKEAEEFKLRNPVLSDKNNRKMYDSDEDDLGDDNKASMGMFNKVDEVSISDAEVEYSLDDDSSLESDGSDIGPRYVDENEAYKKKKSHKSTSGRKGRDSDSEEGEIARVTRKMEAKRNAKSVSSESGRKVKMFEVVDGISHGNVAFAHSAQSVAKRQENKQLERVPLMERLQNMKSSNRDQVIEDTKIIKSDKGLIRSYSFMPKEATGKRGGGILDSTPEDRDVGEIRSFGDKKKRRK
jgi:ribosome biogenesis protein ENP2